MIRTVRSGHRGRHHSRKKKNSSIHAHRPFARLPPDFCPSPRSRPTRFRAQLASAAPAETPSAAAFLLWRDRRGGASTDVVSSIETRQTTARECSTTTPRFAEKIESIRVLQPHTPFKQPRCTQKATQRGVEAKQYSHRRQQQATGYSGRDPAQPSYPSSKYTLIQTVREGEGNLQ